jgi:hypothetical protein|tara:strand:+ start:3112 stop:3723 length:612 start_codon:yes stop_codon:yes gene_type:complete
MAKYARGKKSKAISDRSGLRVKYTELKTTWDGLRVSPEDWEPKHPQLTPAKNVIDATALFNPRPDTDPENVSFFVGYMYDPFLDPRERPTVGVNSFGGVGTLQFEITHTTQTGVGGTGAIGTETPQVSPVETGVAGTGGVGDEIPAAFVTGVSGGGGTGAVGIEAISVLVIATGSGGTGGVGNETAQVLGWGQEGWGNEGWGE